MDINELYNNIIYQISKDIDVNNNQNLDKILVNYSLSKLTDIYYTINYYNSELMTLNYFEGINNTEANKQYLLKIAIAAIKGIIGMEIVENGEKI